MWNKKKKQENFRHSRSSIENIDVPACIGVIVDGNRRWAKTRGLPSHKGHLEGFKKFKEFITWAEEAKVQCVIAYIFSSENWLRSKSEVRHLMGLIGFLLGRELPELQRRGVRLRIIGDREQLPLNIQKAATRAEEETKDGKTLTLVLALSYGGRGEIISAVNDLLKKKTPSENLLITEKELSRHLWTADIPDPDCVIRTSGEMRLSNFLLWQCAYSELFFLKTLWPDLTKKQFLTILSKYGRRQRRFGR